MLLLVCFAGYIHLFLYIVGDPVGSQRGLDISDFSSIVRPREPQGTSILPYKTVGYGSECSHMHCEYVRC